MTTISWGVSPKLYDKQKSCNKNHFTWAYPEKAQPTLRTSPVISSLKRLLSRESWGKIMHVVSRKTLLRIHVFI